MTHDEALQLILRTARHEASHTYQGGCPDGYRPYSRDPECEVCRALDVLATPAPAQPEPTAEQIREWRHKADQYDSIVKAVEAADGGKYRADTISALLSRIREVAQEDEPVVWECKHEEETDGRWRECLKREFAERDGSPGWDVRAFYLHPSRSAGAAAPVEGAAWQPIETAPRDGTHVLVCWPRRLLDDEDFPSGEIVGHATAVSFCSGGYWVEPDYLDAIGASFDDDDAYAPEPTHWMPLPAAPKEKP